MKNLFKVVTLVLGLVVLAYGQTGTPTTTLSTALGGASAASSAPTTVCLTSSTGVNAPGFGQPPLTALGIDREYLPVIATTSSASCWVVARGSEGTAVSAHANGAKVYVGPTGGFSGSPFRNLSPQGGSGSACTGSNEMYLPQWTIGGVGHNNQNGMVWDCISATTGLSTTGAGLWYPINAPEIGPALTDFQIFVPAAGICSGSTSGTAGTGNGTVILDGSVSALKVSATNAGASTNTFTCDLTAAMRTLPGKGITLTQVTVVYGVQTTTATSMSTPTIGYFQGPASGTSETASSATLVTLAGGTLTMTPAVASANLTAVSAGQYYTQLISLGSPIVMNTDLRTYVLSFAVAQSASAAQIVTVPGLWLRGTQIPF